MPVLLRAWPEIHRRTGARLRLVGADPLAVRLVLSRAPGAGRRDRRARLPHRRTTSRPSCCARRCWSAPSLGMESFGMVLTRGFACAVPVVASDIPGYRAVHDRRDRRARSARRRPARSPTRVVALLEDEPRRAAIGEQRAAARDRALLVGHDRRAARADLRGRGRVNVLRQLLRSPWTRGGIVLAFLAGSARCLWWRGPDWADVADAFTVGRVGVGGRSRSGSTCSRSSRARSRGGR